MRLLIHDIRRSFAYAADDLHRAARTIAYPFTSRARDWKYRRDIRLGRAKPPEPITEATLAEAAKALREVYKMIAMQEHADVPRGTSTATGEGRVENAGEIFGGVNQYGESTHPMGGRGRARGRAGTGAGGRDTRA